MFNFNQKIITLISIAVIGIIAVMLQSPIKQDVCYHQFADNRCIEFIPNAVNVISNLSFVIIGLMGLIYSYFKKIKNDTTASNYVFFIGIFLTGIGSSVYHYSPNTITLVWDRIPMTISFMAFFSIIIIEYIHIKFGKGLLWVALTLGIASVLYWYVSELNNCGDLRFYAIVQFLPIVLIPIILIIFKKQNQTYYYWLIILTYIIAKIFEANDYQIFNVYKIISGHSLKHLTASIVPLIYLIKISKKV